MKEFLLNPWTWVWILVFLTVFSTWFAKDYQLAKLKVALHHRAAEFLNQRDLDMFKIATYQMNASDIRYLASLNDGNFEKEAGLCIANVKGR